MSATYWCLVTDSMFQAGVQWPPGLRYAPATALPGYLPGRPDTPHFPGSAWRLIEDDDADQALDGKPVCLILSLADGVPGIAVRNEVTS